jgi:hypothetical protein
MQDKRKAKSCPRGLNHLSRPPREEKTFSRVSQAVVGVARVMSCDCACTTQPTNDLSLPFIAFRQPLPTRPFVFSRIDYIKE